MQQPALLTTAVHYPLVDLEMCGMLWPCTLKSCWYTTAAILLLTSKDGKKEGDGHMTHDGGGLTPNSIHCGMTDKGSQQRQMLDRVGSILLRTHR
jgi:hypothetical protein